ncbi:MOSC N-terminal beta barrel domain-containing protein [Streptomyces sp. NPDC059690]|uniref:MOSC N-terminal beta barrel domain-containing protein n=1 Tax=Streptomyces sp. NPDC059690 TaxID=3346907 RepID=UPI0036B1BA77
MGTVAALYRYPVKSMLGEAVIAAAVTERGFAGDRVYAVLDDAGARRAPTHATHRGRRGASHGCPFCAAGGFPVRGPSRPYARCGCRRRSWSRSRSWCRPARRMPPPCSRRPA